MISPSGLKRKEKASPFATVLRGIPGGVQEVVTATDDACSLGTQEAAAWPLAGGDSRGPDLPAPSLFMTFLPLELQLLDLKAQACAHHPASVLLDCRALGHSTEATSSFHSYQSYAGFVPQEWASGSSRGLFVGLIPEFCSLTHVSSICPSVNIPMYDITVFGSGETKAQPALCRSQPVKNPWCVWTGPCGSYYGCEMPSAIPIRKL